MWNRGWPGLVCVCLTGRLQAGLISSAELVEKHVTDLLPLRISPVREQGIRESSGVRLLHSSAAHLDHHCQEERGDAGGAVLRLGACHHRDGN